MKQFLALFLLIGIGLSNVSADGDGYLEARRLVREGKILPLEQILDGLSQFKSGQILEVEFDDHRQGMRYEIEILDSQGTVWELKVDAVTGEILEQELED
ncbi:MAG: PepSY domain-containing protein [Candidatus Thiodiazotropha sp.]